MKPFFTNNGHINGEELILKCDNNETVTESSVLAEMFNSHYINIAEKTSRKKPSHFARDKNVPDTRQVIGLIAQSYQITLASIVLRLLLKIKSLQLHLLAMFVEQIQKKYFNF